MPSALLIPSIDTVVVTQQPQATKVVVVQRDDLHFGQAPLPCPLSPGSEGSHTDKHDSQDSQQESRAQQTPCIDLPNCFTNSKGVAMYTMSEVKRHNHTKSAWIVAGKDIYDITSYLGVHPGGSSSLLRRAGGAKDCTEDFKFHSKKGQRQWDQFKIGRLVQLQEERKDKPKAWWTYWNQ
mmetsp:Transcript_9445/g.23033  ORF Transcript_9445/g.23033 Transcript_9445/m.23033 type:complete len:180 (+) Transcript_9445:89-628(+)